ncbi:hypothetical protein 8014-B2_0064 [Lactobacillus phage ATCC 8014-B2]|uniref:Uncharacterized protein n=1 Tax=Lactobacillus phage ATCC 8014-B2 TaxID=1225795 RepID=K4HZS1_9CAUD|nr:hypothetical protein HOQ89_gp082 [Lactobacillus phage ATCC 8014-B2]AFU63131.1 hypothetical protein 8014-B2_0064 [Lactobacillus phage ATCC 8014-B2]
MTLKDYLLDNFDDIIGDGDFVAVLSKHKYNRLISVVYSKEDANQFRKDIESLTNDELEYEDGTIIMTIARLTDGSSSVSAVTDDYNDFIKYGTLPSIYALMDFSKDYEE